MAQSKELNISPDLIAEAVKRALEKLGQGPGTGLGEIGHREVP